MSSRNNDANQNPDNLLPSPDYDQHLEGFSICDDFYFLLHYWLKEEWMLAEIHIWLSWYAGRFLLQALTIRTKFDADKKENVETRNKKCCFSSNCCLVQSGVPNAICISFVKLARTSSPVAQKGEHCLRPCCGVRWPVSRTPCYTCWVLTRVMSLRSLSPVLFVNWTEIFCGRTWPLIYNLCNILQLSCVTQDWGGALAIISPPVLGQWRHYATVCLITTLHLTIISICLWQTIGISDPIS